MYFNDLPIQNGDLLLLAEFTRGYMISSASRLLMRHSSWDGFSRGHMRSLDSPKSNLWETHAKPMPWTGLSLTEKSTAKYHMVISISPLWHYHDIAIISLWNGCFSKAHWMSDTWTGNPGTYSTGGCWPISKPWAKKRALGKCRIKTVAPSMFKTAAVFTSHKFWHFYTSSKQSLPPFLMFHPKPNPNRWCFSPPGRKLKSSWSPHWMGDSKPYLPGLDPCGFSFKKTHDWVENVIVTV